MSMNGARVALLESRKGQELAAILRSSGGEPYLVPSLVEIPLDCKSEVDEALSKLASGRYTAIVFLTGVGANALIENANALGRGPEFLALLENLTTICRGPKPVAVLKRNGIHISATAPEPFTTTELAELMRGMNLSEHKVLVVHYGERSDSFEKSLTDAGIEVDSLCLYEWRLPEDISPLETVVHKFIAGELDAVAFTSQVQVRHLFQIAGGMGLEKELAQALNSKVVVASIGPTCTACLAEYGIVPRIIPEHPKMGHLIHALHEYWEQKTD